ARRGRTRRRRRVSGATARGWGGGERAERPDFGTDARGGRCGPVARARRSALERVGVEGEGPLALAGGAGRVAGGGEDLGGGGVEVGGVPGGGEGVLDDSAGGVGSAGLEVGAGERDLGLGVGAGAVVGFGELDDAGGVVAELEEVLEGV